MISAICRPIAGFVVWCCCISPAGAGCPPYSRDISETVLYRFGQQIFVESARAGSLVSESQSVFAPDPDVSGPVVVESDADGAAADRDEDLLSDTVE